MFIWNQIWYTLLPGRILGTRHVSWNLASWGCYTKKKIKCLSLWNQRCFNQISCASSQSRTLARTLWNLYISHFGFWPSWYFHFFSVFSMAGHRSHRWILVESGTVIKHSTRYPTPLKIPPSFQVYICAYNIWTKVLPLFHLNPWVTMNWIDSSIILDFLIFRNLETCQIISW